jgi:hypothetical protein
VRLFTRVRRGVESIRNLGVDRHSLEPAEDDEVGSDGCLGPDQFVICRASEGL